MLQFFSYATMIGRRSWNSLVSHRSKKMIFSQWIEFEADRIVSIGQNLPEERRVGYIRFQIEGALRKAFAHGRDGLTESDEPRAV